VSENNNNEFDFIDFESLFDQGVREYNARNGLSTNIKKEEKPKTSSQQAQSPNKLETQKPEASKPEKKELTIKKQPKGEKIKQYLRKREEEKWNKASVVAKKESKPLDEDKKFDIALGLATIGIAGLIGVGTIFASKAAYNWGYNKSYNAGSEFWEDTKKNMEKRREEYIKLYGDPEKKQENPPSNDNLEPDK